jgi:hypothetical protein
MHAVKLKISCPTDLLLDVIHSSSSYSHARIAEQTYVKWVIYCCYYTTLYTLENGNTHTPLIFE